MQSNDEKKIYYCVGEPQSTDNFNLTVDKLGDFFPDKTGNVRIFKTKDDAARYRRDRISSSLPPGQCTSDYYVPICEIQLKPRVIFIGEQADNGEEVTFDKADNSAEVAFNDISILTATVDVFLKSTRKYERSRRNDLNGYLVTEAGVLRAFEKFERDNALGLSKGSVDKYPVVSNYIGNIFIQINALKMHPFSNMSILLSHTTVLLHSLLEERNHLLGVKVGKKLTYNAIMAELECIEKGLSFLGRILDNPLDQDSRQEFQKFVKNAPGRTNYWKMWSGALTSAAAIALFSTGIALIGPQVAGAGGALFLLLIACAALSFSGKEKGVAKQLRYFAESKNDQTASTNDPAAARRLLGAP